MPPETLDLAEEALGIDRDAVPLAEHVKGRGATQALVRRGDRRLALGEPGQERRPTATGSDPEGDRTVELDQITVADAVENIFFRFTNDGDLRQDSALYNGRVG